MDKKLPGGACPPGSFPHIRIIFCKSSQAAARTAYIRSSPAASHCQTSPVPSASAAYTAQYHRQHHHHPVKPFHKGSLLAQAAHPAKPDRLPSLTATACLTRTFPCSRSTYTPSLWGRIFTNSGLFRTIFPADVGSENCRRSDCQPDAIVSKNLDCLFRRTDVCSRIRRHPPVLRLPPDKHRHNRYQPPICGAHPAKNECRGIPAAPCCDQHLPSVDKSDQSFAVLILTVLDRRSRPLSPIIPSKILSSTEPEPRIIEAASIITSSTLALPKVLSPDRVTNPGGKISEHPSAPH